MKVQVHLTDTQIDKLIKQMVILIDTREQENAHITDYLDKKKIPYIVRKLDFGDYSVMLTAAPDLGLPFDVSLEHTIAVERKGASGNGLTEIAKNFTDGRQAFENEFIRACHSCEHFYLVIENGSWKSIAEHKYRSEMSPKALYNSLISWRHKYGFQIDFVSSENFAEHLIKLFGTTLKKLLEE